MASSSKTIRNENCDDNSFDVTEAPILAKLDNDQIDPLECDKGFLPELATADGCDSAIVQLRSRGQGYLRHNDTLRAEIQVMEPLTASADESKIELGLLPWPTEMNDAGEIVAMGATPIAECNDAGYWSSRPRQHPTTNVGRLAWPVDCNGDPAAEVAYDAAVGTYRTRDGHPVIHKPKAPSGASFGPITKFTSTTTGSFPAVQKEPLEVGLTNVDCCCELNLVFNVHYTYTINGLVLPNGAKEINLAFKGYAGQTGTTARCWTFNQCPLPNIENKIISGHSTLQVTIPPKSGATMNFWAEIGTGIGETVQPKSYNINSQIEVTYLGGLNCS